MKTILKEGTKRRATCDECGCLFSFESEDIYHIEKQSDKFFTVAGIKHGYKMYVTCPQCEHEIVLEATR
jgi:Fe2+ or Zn2+ uptake regulation protein